MKSMSQVARLVIVLVYVGLLLCICKYIFGSWTPPTSEKGVWFYSGLASLLLGSMLVTPYFTKPVDSVSNAVAAMVALLAVDLRGTAGHTDFERFLWAVTNSYVVLVLLAAMFAIAFRGSASTRRQRVATSAYALSTVMGAPKWVFSAVFLFAVVTFHRTNPREYIPITLSWIAFIGLQPLETLAGLIVRWRQIWAKDPSVELCGEVVGHQTPGIVLIRHQHDTPIQFGEVLLARAENGKPGLAVALDHVGFAEGCWLRAVHLSISEEVARGAGVTVSEQVSQGAVARIDCAALGVAAIADKTWQSKDRLVGLVAPDTSISRLQVEVIRTDLDLEEGRLLEVQIGPKNVLYQLINGLTKEEILQQKNTRAYVRADAKKVGSWDAAHGRFEVVKWIPSPNAPVFLSSSASPSPDKNAIGHFPGTSFPVTVDVSSIVIHNSAILGVLGIGKTYLALELVERMLAAGVKVICLDLTNQYATGLQPYNSSEPQESQTKQLQEIGKSGKTHYGQNVEEGGSVSAFRGKLHEVLTEFLAPTNAEKLRIYNPAHFEVWRQDRTPDYKTGKASMASLTPVEVTRIITEVALEVVQLQGMSESARCCLVFEEAHSLVPEWTALASDQDRAATNGTAKAILQGRKFGLGCLVVTQRTANVTKSILNQCNTVFALRVFDATGMEFLRNYIGEDYAGTLSTLSDRHAVVFGRASSCRDPVLIRLNDREDFLSLFRNAH
jgi:hypothetical protein